MPELFESHAKRNIDPQKWLIGAAALVLIAGAAYGLFLWSTPAKVTDDEILADEVRQTTVLMLDYKTFSGDEFRQQILGKGRLERYVKVNDEAFFTFPQTDPQEFDEFITKYFYDRTKIELGKKADGVIKLGDYEAPMSPRYGEFFRTNLGNIRIEPRQTLNFPYATVNYTLSLEEMRNYANNSQTYGGKLITQAPSRSNRPTMIFANHGIMVAKPAEPSLRRLADELLKDVTPTREARIQRLVDFVSAEIEYSYTEAVGSRETLKRASETLMTRTGDCSNKTILLASLLEQIGEEYVLLYCPQHITVAVPQGGYPNDNKLDFTWNGKPWVIAETTLPGFQVGVTKVNDFSRLTRVEYVQNPKNADVIFDANSYEVLKFL
ncbi:MAG: transglutaminase domain-containing protein [Pyrinomonadaceae bacterium]|nr:transglutaminase domain-containing protein [Pyrinomonadaceae bacterium]MBP6211507.1 transglutaminase domain-containing protein [Pyrinomonadaceae bacterium]